MPQLAMSGLVTVSLAGRARQTALQGALAHGARHFDALPRLCKTRFSGKVLGNRVARVPQVTHIVLVSWQNGRARAVEDAIRPAIRDFRKSINGILSVVEGHSSSPEGLESGYDYGFVVTFESAQARDSYLTDPTHQVVAEEIGACARHLAVFDI
ncbi:MAG TPA: Dabb family protein [Propionibacteriaceae bacterium]|nr:Dabb family protein [Propionibacteriaceae bacterium]